ncbi:DNA primase large subunit [Nematostella vectensis]|uniref:DNA primase large subunit n=1 Tax=Nematostella vectensis TaxID=45351 RepID=UPI0020779B9E|nr:DNA primase large subunit [Nematostella vectensis]
MQFSGSARGNLVKKPVLSGGREESRYPDRLQMYKIPPTDNISLEEFEELAIERLKVLREVETLGIRFKRESKEYKEKMSKHLSDFLPHLYISNMYSSKSTANDEYDDKRKDHISHFILRLAYCRSEDLRRWFLLQESELFRFRFVTEEEGKGVEEFLQHNSLSYTPIGEEEKTTFLEKLRDSGYNLTDAAVLASKYYKVHFTEALDLVRSRKVFLREGSAYIPHQSLVSIITNVFRTQLSHALAVTARALPYLEEDDRLLPRLSNLSRQYLGQDYSQKKNIAGGKITLDQIDAVSQKSFPLCMRQLHQNLRENHHLKHGGRMQYGLFLKGIGLTLEESLAFWRTEFIRIMDLDKFDKQYAYNIRHNYGKEGKRADYTPYSCMKIIMSNQPGPGDCHGCPYRHTDPDLLRQHLARHKLGKEGLDEIMKLVKETHYQLACTRFFEVTHNVSGLSAFNHPNQYFEESRKGATPNLSGLQSTPLSQGVKRESTSSTTQSNEEMAIDDEVDDQQLMEIAMNA